MPPQNKRNGEHIFFKELNAELWDLLFGLEDKDMPYIRNQLTFILRKVQSYRKAKEAEK